MSCAIVYWLFVYLSCLARGTGLSWVSQFVPGRWFASWIFSSRISPVRILWFWGREPPFLLALSPNSHFRTNCSFCLSSFAPARPLNYSAPALISLYVFQTGGYGCTDLFKDVLLRIEPIAHTVKTELFAVEFAVDSQLWVGVYFYAAVAWRGVQTHKHLGHVLGNNR